MPQVWGSGWGGGSLRPPVTSDPLPLFCSDEEVPGGNPLVAGFQDDVDIEDKPPSRPLLPVGPITKENITSSSEEEAEKVAGHPKATVPIPQKCSEPETKRYVYGIHPGGGGSQGHPDFSFVPKALHKSCQAAQGYGSQGCRVPPAKHPQTPR